LGSGGVYADSGGVEAGLHWRLYQMIPIRGEMFAADVSLRRSIIVVLRWIVPDGRWGNVRWVIRSRSRRFQMAAFVEFQVLS
jgi:hypothetical protein